MTFFVVMIFIIFFIATPTFRTMVFNVLPSIYYIIKDAILYVYHQKWKEWNEYGLDIYTGIFGRGKSLSIVHYARKMYKRFKITIISNVELKGIPYIPLTNESQLINPPDNCLILIDEVSTLFNSREYQNFNMELLYTLLQNRHRKIKLVATAQRFFHVDKLMRDITTNVIECHKYWRFQTLRYYDAWDYENNPNPMLIKFKKKRCWFVRDKDYKCYDTNQMVSKKEFISNKEIREKRGEYQTSAYNSNLNRKGRKTFQ